MTRLLDGKEKKAKETEKAGGGRGDEKEEEEELRTEPCEKNTTNKIGRCPGQDP
jgi:hypothetical protein